MGWHKNGTPETLTGSDDTITISNLSKLSSNQIIWHSINTGGNISLAFRVGNGSVDTGNNYAERRTIDGAGDTTDTTTDNFGNGWAGVAYDTFGISYFVNIDGVEKLFISWWTGGTAGAGTAQQREESVGKHVTTSGQLNTVEMNDTGAGTYAVGSNISALGTTADSGETQE